MGQPPVSSEQKELKISQAGKQAARCLILSCPFCLSLTPRIMSYDTATGKDEAAADCFPLSHPPSVPLMLVFVQCCLRHVPSAYQNSWCTHSPGVRPQVLLSSGALPLPHGSAARNGGSQDSLGHESIRLQGLTL